MSQTERLPDYAPMLGAYHRAYEGELKEMIGGLPVAEGDRVIELACGDGVYSRWLAGRVGEAGGVVAVDILSAYLDVAREATRRMGEGGRIQFAVADVARLPFAEGTFDLAWCAQSLYSLPDPVEALRRMTRLVRPGGVVAVLENDTLHHVLLPWPIDIELAVRHAEWLALREESSKPRKYYIGRQLCEVFRSAGLVGCRKRTWASNRQAPLGPLERTFLTEYLRDLRERASPHLEPKTRGEFERLTDPSSDHFLLDGPDLSVTCVDHVVWGTRPETR